MGLNLDGNNIVFLDTSPFIYFFEKHPDYFPFMESFFDEVYQKGVQVITSIITFVEIATVPARLNNQSLVGKYREYFTHSENIGLFSVDLTIAEQTISLRTRYNLRTPDAIQLGTALACGADYIVTHDKQWRRFTDIPVLMVDEL